VLTLTRELVTGSERGGRGGGGKKKGSKKRGKGNRKRVGQSSAAIFFIVKRGNPERKVTKLSSRNRVKNPESAINLSPLYIFFSRHWVEKKKGAGEKGGGRHFFWPYPVIAT